MRFAYYVCMRFLAFMLVFAIGLTTLAPAPATYPRTGQSVLSIQALDVCNSSATGIDLILPYFIQECPCSPLPPMHFDIRTITAIFFDPLLLPFQDERPPRA